MNEIIIVTLAIAAVVVFTDILLFLFAHLGHWARLAEAYPAHYPPAGRAHYFQSAKLGWVGYNNALIARVSPEGLYLAMPPFFNFGHRPMLIPWSEMQIVEQQGWTGHWAAARVGDPLVGTLAFRWVLAAEARQLGYLPARPSSR